MAESIQSLEELLRALGRERNLRGRLRVLARAWALLRSLSPAQREQVALRVGSRWAWRRIEKSFLRDGELDEAEQMIGTAFQRMGEADPQEIRRLARSIREGDKQTTRDLLMLTLTEALEEEAEEREEQEEATPEPEPVVVGQLEEPEAAAAEVPQVVERPTEVLASSRARVVAEPEPAPQPEPAPVPAPAPASTPTPALPAAPVHLPPPAPEPIPLAGPEPDPPAAGITQLNGTERLRVLRELQRSDAPAKARGRAGRAELLDALGGGWATRRALSRMIAAGSLDDVDEALEHVRRLGRPGQQTWCLADLLVHGALTGPEIERVLDAAPSDAARRRLARRVPPAP
ncbi:MAG: hypothetical protein ACQGVC_19085 [Myxococcota bacterium]